ncbi:MAG: UbiA family prenyltransferase [Methylococcales bacterium]|nr:UbiA family prenyltransferase [Methylococcales bacterium]
MSNNDLNNSSLPLCVDLDGTLIKTDSLHESVLQLLRQKAIYCIIGLSWAIKSKAFFKAKLTEHVKLSPKSLPYNDDIIKYIQSQPEDREILLVTGANAEVADSIADYLDIFDEVLASNSEHNLTGHNKRQFLVDRFGEKGFEYIGNEEIDLSVWSSAGQVSVVSQENSFLQKVRETFTIEKEFQLPSPSISDYLKAIHINQWVISLLVFVAYFIDHNLNDSTAISQLTICFFCVSFITSFTHILNDLLNLGAHRLNNGTSLSPFASGLISIKQAAKIIIILSLLIIASLSFLSIAVITVLIIYFATSLSYLLYFKNITILGKTVLAGLFCLIVLSGMIAIEAKFSFF